MDKIQDVIPEDKQPELLDSIQKVPALLMAPPQDPAPLLCTSFSFFFIT